MTITKVTHAMIDAVFISVNDYGASPSNTPAENTVAIQNAVDDCPGNGVVDLNYQTYEIDAAIVVDKRITIQNGRLQQTTEAENVLEIVGPLAYGPTLINLQLSHDFNTSSAGSLLDIGDYVGFMTWNGSNGNCEGGYYGVRSHGHTYMMHFTSVWISSTYSSAWYMPASGDVVTNVALGGSTTTRLTNCFVTDIQTDAPAYAIGTGYDTVRLDTCAADNVSQFAFFKAQPVEIVNCSSEGIREPIVGSLSGPHSIIEFASGIGQRVDGFHVTFAGGFTPPAPGPGNVNSFIKAINPSNLEVFGVRGAVPGGYFLTDLQGGTGFFNNNLGFGSGVRLTSGAIIGSTNLTAADDNTVHTFGLYASDNDFLEFQLNDVKIGSIRNDATGPNDKDISINVDGNGNSLNINTKNNIGSLRTLVWNAQNASFYPETDGNINLGKSGNKWDTVWAATGSINTSDKNGKEYITDISDAEKRVALKIKKLFKRFQYKKAIAQKSENARLHFGIIAQDVEEAFKSEKLDPNRYGLFCYDEWIDKNGNKQSQYGIRYDELFAFIISSI